MPESIQIQLKKGVLEMCVLTLLARGDSYGYELFTRLMAQIGMGEGTIYPLMRRMQNDGLVGTYLTEFPGGCCANITGLPNWAAPRWWRSARNGRIFAARWMPSWETTHEPRAVHRRIAPGVARPVAG